MPDNGQFRVGEEPLHHVLVHARCRAQHAGADISNARQFEEPLDSTVLAKGSMQHRKNHVQRLPAQRRVAVDGRMAGMAQRSGSSSLSGFRRQQRRLTLGQHPRSWSGRRIAGPQLLPGFFTGFRCPRLQPPGYIRPIALQQPLRRAGGQPVPGLVDADGHHVELLPIDGLQNRSRRQERNLMLAAAPAKQYPYT